MNDNFVTDLSILANVGDQISASTYHGDLCNIATTIPNQRSPLSTTIHVFVNDNIILKVLLFCQTTAHVSDKSIIHATF